MVDTAHLCLTSDALFMFFVLSEHEQLSMCVVVSWVKPKLSRTFSGPDIEASRLALHCCRMSDLKMPKELDKWVQLDPAIHHLSLEQSLAGADQPAGDHMSLLSWSKYPQTFTNLYYTLFLYSSGLCIGSPESRNKAWAGQVGLFLISLYWNLRWPLRRRYP